MKKVLVIEDNQDVRENIADILELENYKVITAENGKIGVEKAFQNVPDIIICDIMMPELDGYEVFKHLSVNPKMASVPFVFLTAKAEKEDMRKGMNLGADDYIIKPFDEHELLDAIESRLKKHDFLKKEFSRNIEGVSQFIEAASNYMDLEHLSRKYSPRKYKKKDIVFMEGTAANSLYFIEEGGIKTFKTTAQGKEFVTGLHYSGDFIGQLSLLSDNGSYIESATVLNDSELYQIPKLDFLTLIHGNRDVSNKFIHLITNNLVEVQDQLVNVAFSTVRQRVAKALLYLQNKQFSANKSENGISITREDFAGLIGTATATAIRMLTEFKDEGLITIGAGRKITIEDKEALEKIVIFN